MEQLKYFTFLRYRKLRHEIRKQVFWLVDRLISLNIPGCDGLVLGLLRQTKGGDRSQENEDHMLSVFFLLRSHLPWVVECGPMVPYILYFSLRVLAEDHLPEQIIADAIEICSSLLYQKYRECSLLGRDLVRCLVEVARIPQIRQLWEWLLRQRENGQAPLALLLQTPTPKRYLSMRLTPEAETDLKFLLERPPSSQQGFYLPLFISNHIPSAPGDDGGAIISDVLRYVVGVIHPTNATLASPVIQRWMLIMTLLKSLRTSYAASTAKLSLFLDWMTFNPGVDTIMCVEPGILLLTKSSFDSPNITSTLVEFLALSASNFYPPLSHQIRESIRLVIELCIQRGVISSLDKLHDSPMLPLEIKKLLLSLVSPRKDDDDRSEASTINCDRIVGDALQGAIGLEQASSMLLRHFDEPQIAKVVRRVVDKGGIDSSEGVPRLFELLARLKCAKQLVSDITKSVLLRAEASHPTAAWRSLVKAENGALAALSHALIHWILHDPVLDLPQCCRALSLLIFIVSKVDSKTALEIVSSLSCLMKVLPQDILLLFVQGLRSSCLRAYPDVDADSWLGSWNLSEDFYSAL